MSDDTEDESPFLPMVKAQEQLWESFTRLAERFPAMKPMLDEEIRKTQERMVDTWKPMLDFADGKITREEYLAITHERREADKRARVEHYGPNRTLELECAECGTEYEWDRADHDGEYPPIYFVCEDIGEESCTEDEDG